ncbi:hypothetical protein [Sphingomonas sp. AP4-R1]|uniref:hypothetical protein n=1 Tax=Sphingomonas sp. AP4-R1 TaxID=2735134 RepID=UPI001493873C|nr:hypothetical protein [Sphingomonas sp. AP4-R1]
MRAASIRAAFRVGVFGALGGVIAEMINGHAGDRVALALFAVEVWAIAFVAWLLVEAMRRR